MVFVLQLMCSLLQFENNFTYNLSGLLLTILTFVHLIYVTVSFCL